jgi:hypothetical protein
MRKRLPLPKSPDNVVALHPGHDAAAVPPPKRVARLVMALTPSRVKALKARQGIYADGGCPNLWLRCTLDGRQVWIMRFQFWGVRHELGLGSVDNVALEEAREAVIEAQNLMHKGIDPLVQRRAQQAAVRRPGTTFSAVLESYLSVHSAKWSRCRLEDEWRNSLATHLPSIMALPIQNVDTKLLAKALRPLWISQNKLAERLRYRIEVVWNFAKSGGLVAGDNPARRKGLPGPAIATKSRARSL